MMIRHCERSEAICCLTTYQKIQSLRSAGWRRSNLLGFIEYRSVFAIRQSAEKQSVGVRATHTSEGDPTRKSSDYKTLFFINNLSRKMQKDYMNLITLFYSISVD
jgi:hypothetical protein